MKKLLLIILLCNLSNIQAQEFSITDQGNKWGIRWYDGHCDTNPESGCNPTGLYAAEIIGEIFINNITYTILSGLEELYIREEEGIVYQYVENEEEIILYDFTLEVGDTVPLGPEVGCVDDENNNNLADVIEVSTEFIAGYNRKVITFDIGYGSNFSDNVQWIEGIGSANEPTNPDFLLCDLVFFVDCFNNGEEIFSFSSFEEECNELLSTPEVLEITTQLTPNPITEQSTLTINTFQNNTTIIFYNTLGQRLRQKELTNNRMTINRDDFPSSGIYFYQIAQNGVVVDTQKFIIN